MTIDRDESAELPAFPFPNSTPVQLDEQYARLRAEQPVARVALYGAPAWLVTRHEDVQVVLADPRFSLARAIEPGVPRLGTFELPPGSILASDPPDHTRVRKLVTKVFTVRRIEQMRPHVQEVVDELLDRLAASDPPVDLIEEFTALLPLRIICEMLGVPHSDRERFREWVELIMTVSGKPAEQVQGGWARMQEYIAELVAQKRRDPADDLLSGLVAARDQEDKLAEHELVLFGLALLVAGHETTKNQLANSVLTLLAQHPDQWHRLREHPDLIPAAVDELLRYVALFGFDVTFPRVATHDLELGGVAIAAGDTVLAAVSSANRDEAAFDSPDTLDLHRADNHHLAFGTGIHRCLGAQLARLELEVGLGGLIQRFPSLKLAANEDEMEWVPGAFVHSLRSLPVKW